MRSHRLLLAALERAHRGAAEHVVHQTALAGARDAGHRGEPRERKARRHVLQIVVRRPFDHQEPGRLIGPPRAGDLLLAAQIARRLRVGARDALAARTRVEEVAAGFARARTEVRHEVRGPHHQRLVFHHDERVAATGELAQQLGQAVAVARVQAHRRLIEHVERVRQIGAERVCQLDPLRLAARQRARQAIEGEIAEVHAQQETQARFQLLQHGGRDLAALGGELEPEEKLVGGPDGQRRDLGDRAAGQAHE